MKINFLRLTGFAVLLSISAMSQSCKKSKNESANTPRSAITADIAGSTWYAYDEVTMDNSLTMYTLTVYDPSSNVWFQNAPTPWDMRPRPGNGIKLTPNGDFEICRFTNSGVGGLKSYSFFYMKGTAVQANNEITLYPNIHQSTYNSVSDPSLNYNKSLDKTPTKISYAVLRYENNWEEVTVTWSDGSSSKFYRHW